MKIYAIGFSYGYWWIDAGLGALLLFGVVQVTMFTAALMARQEAISVSRWIGTGIALTGLALLLLPGAAASWAARSSRMCSLTDSTWARFSSALSFSTRSTEAARFTRVICAENRGCRVLGPK